MCKENFGRTKFKVEFDDVELVIIRDALLERMSVLDAIIDFANQKGVKSCNSVLRSELEIVKNVLDIVNDNCLPL